jgi:hypothetical protein
MELVTPSRYPNSVLLTAPPPMSLADKVAFSKSEVVLLYLKT